MTRKPQRAGSVVWNSLLVFSVLAFASIAHAQAPPAEAPAPEAAGTPAPPVEPPAVVPAAEKAAPGLTASGSFFSRYELREGTFGSRLTDSDAVRQRARLGLHSTQIDVADQMWFKAHMVPQAGGFWNVGGNSLTDAAFGLHEGYVDLHIGEKARLDIGRFEMAYGEHLMIGTVGWHHLGRAFDGARLHLTPGASKMYVDAFFTTLAEGLVDGVSGEDFGAGDMYFGGVYVGLGPLVHEHLALDVYLLSRIWGELPETADPADPTLTIDGKEASAEMTAGVRTKGKAGAVMFRFEGGVQFGQRPGTGYDGVGTLAYQADLEVGVDLKDAASMHASVEGFFASGDDPDTEESEAWNHLFPTAHKWMGLMDLIGARSNVYGGVLHLVGFFDPIVVKLDTHAFFRPQIGPDAEKFQGTELDLNVIYKLGKGAKVRALYGQFIPETAGSFDEHLHFVEVELGLTF